MTDPFAHRSPHEPRRGSGRRGTGHGGHGPYRPDPRGTRPSHRHRHGDAARTVAFDVLRAVDVDDAYANLVLPGLIRRHGLSGADAGLATELTYGTLRRRGTWDAILATCVDRPLDRIDPPVLDALRLGTHQLLAMRVPAHAAVDQSVALVRAACGQGAAGFANAVLRRVAGSSLDEWLARVAPGDGDADLAVRYSHPEWIVRALRQSLVAHGRPASDLPALLESDNVNPVVSLIALPGLSEPAELLEAGGTPGAWMPGAVQWAAGAPGSLAAVRQGRARVQDEGSQLVAAALAALPLDGPDRRWVDLCAGPGGKSALLATAAADRGAALTAVEISEHRADLVRQALRPVPGDWEVRAADGRDVGRDEAGRYDRALVDVPCTGLGALRRRPEARWRHTPADLAALGPVQCALLASALDAVRVGGVVVYSTCSPHPAETVAVVEDVVRRGRAEPVDLGPVVRAVTGRDIDVGPGPWAQLWPDLHRTDAMFFAAVRRTA